LTGTSTHRNNRLDDCFTHITEMDAIANEPAGVEDAIAAGDARNLQDCVRVESGEMMPVRGQVAGKLADLER
jgi:hypothetical protein